MPEQLPSSLALRFAYLVEGLKLLLREMEAFSAPRMYRTDTRGGEVTYHYGEPGRKRAEAACRTALHYLARAGFEVHEPPMPIALDVSDLADSLIPPSGDDTVDLREFGIDLEGIERLKDGEPWQVRCEVCGDTVFWLMPQPLDNADGMELSRRLYRQRRERHNRMRHGTAR